jgi:hypothetical protein
MKTADSSRATGGTAAAARIRQDCHCIISHRLAVRLHTISTQCARHHPGRAFGGPRASSSDESAARRLVRRDLCREHRSPRMARR